MLSAKRVAEFTVVFARSLPQRRCPNRSHPRDPQLGRLEGDPPGRSDGQFNPETGTTTQGETVEEAVANLKKATALYLSEIPLPAPGHPVVTMFSLPANA